MKTLGILLIGGALTAGVPSSSVTLTEQNGAGQTNRPVTIPRRFAVGEIVHYAKPTITGVGVPSVWQNDVRTRWRDGSGSCSVTGATNATPIVVACANGGFQEGESVTITGVGGNTAANGTFLVRAVSTSGFSLMNSAGNGSYTSGGSAAGPGEGSLKDVSISFPATLTASGTITVTFSDTTDQCSSGNTAACNAASLDASGMLAFNGGTWSATIQTVASSITKSAAARTMLADAAVQITYWRRGPAVTQVVVEDASTQTYDWAYACASNCSGTYSTATWTDDSATHKTLHPIFVLSFPTSWAGVQVEYILENAWTTGLQDQRYDLTLSDSSGTRESYTMPHYAKSRWHRSYWDGSEPGGNGAYRTSVKTDLNKQYLVYAHAIPSYLLTVTANSSTITSFNTSFGNNTVSGHNTLACPNGGTCGNIEMVQNGGGERNAAIGLQNIYESLYWMSMSPTALGLVEGNAQIAGLMPTHFREAASRAIAYDPGGQYAAQTRWISRWARPTVEVTTSGDCQVAGDKVTPVATLSTSVAWVPDNGHFPSTAYSAYVATGDWFYANEQQAQAAWNFATANLVVPIVVAGTTGICAGFIQSFAAGGRYAGWPLREALYANQASLDGSGEQAYFAYVFLQNAEYYAGFWGCTTCALFETQRTSPITPATEQSLWAKGKWAQGAQPNPLGFANGTGSNAQTKMDMETSTIPTDANSTDFWMQSFQHTVMGLGGQWGFPTTDVTNSMARLYTTAAAASAAYVFSAVPDLGGCVPAAMHILCHGGFISPVFPIGPGAGDPKLTSAVTSSGSDTTWHVDAVPGWNPTGSTPVVAKMASTKAVTAITTSPPMNVTSGEFSGADNGNGIRIFDVVGTTAANCAWQVANKSGSGTITFDIVAAIQWIGGNPMTVHSVYGCWYVGQSVVISGVVGCTDANSSWTISAVNGNQLTLSGAGACNAGYSSGGIVQPGGNSAYVSGGVVTALAQTESVLVTAENSGAGTITVVRGSPVGNTNAHISGAYIFGFKGYQTWPDLTAGLNSINALTAGIYTALNYLWANMSYPAYAMGAASFGVGASGGEAAFSFFYDSALAAGATFTNTCATNGKWCLLPYRDAVGGVSVSPILSAQVTINYTAPVATVACTVDGASDGTTNSRTRAFVKTGLSPSTTYSSTIHCADDPYLSGDTSVGYTTAAASSGAVTGRVSASGRVAIH